MKKSINSDQNTMSLVDETPVEIKKIIYAQEIPMGSVEPKYEDMKKAVILPSAEEIKEKERLSMKKIVRGTFDYRELSGGTLEFFYNSPFKGEPIVKYTLVDGETYALPKGVVRHIKSTGFITVNEYALDPENPMKKNIRVGKKVLRYDFHVESEDPDLRDLADSRILQIR